MSDTIVKVEAGVAAIGSRGQHLLAAGKRVAMRLWEEDPGERKEVARRDYEVVGYVIDGRAVIETEGNELPLTPGDSWVIPAGAEHRYRIVEHFKAVEATSPPAE
jgi:quercetin dioxygenase-like cupin family protein